MTRIKRTKMSIPTTSEQIRTTPAHAFRIDDATGTSLLALVKTRGGYNLTHWQSGRVFSRETCNGAPVSLKDAFTGALDLFACGAYTAQQIEKSAQGLAICNAAARHPFAGTTPARAAIQPQPQTAPPVQPAGPAQLVMEF